MLGVLCQLLDRDRAEHPAIVVVPDQLFVSIQRFILTLLLLLGEDHLVLEHVDSVLHQLGDVLYIQGGDRDRITLANDHDASTATPTQISASQPNTTTYPSQLIAVCRNPDPRLSHFLERE